VLRVLQRLNDRVLQELALDKFGSSNSASMPTVMLTPERLLEFPGALRPCKPPVALFQENSALPY